MKESMIKLYLFLTRYAFYLMRWIFLMVIIMLHELLAWPFCVWKTQILRENPSYPEALIGRGTAYAFQRELDAAIADFTKVYM